jgi:hypothetical protein
MKKRVQTKTLKPKGTIIGHKAFAAITEVEGLRLSKDGRERVSGNFSTEKRRAKVLKAYAGAKGRK